MWRTRRSRAISRREGVGVSGVPADATEAMIAEMSHIYGATQRLAREELFVGQGLKNGLLLTSSNEDANGASHSVSSVCTESTRIPTALFLVGLRWSGRYICSRDSTQEFVDTIRSLAKFLRETERPAFAALDASPLTEIRNKYGPQSEQYTITLLELRSLVNVAMALSDNLNFAYLTYSTHVRDKRAAEPQQTQSPLPSDRPSPSNRLAPFQPALLPPTLAPMALRLALVGDNVSRRRRPEEVVSYAPAGLPRPARVPKQRRMCGLGKAANGKMSAAHHQQAICSPDGTVVLVILLVVGSVGSCTALVTKSYRVSSWVVQ
ncbi:hypothetical protein IMY05_C4477000200 [Salix suchowensis]|nr:hypothetical protein IMY05_C4477000200 [Salix suchowensis]